MYIHGGGEAGDILPLNYGSATSYQGGGAFNFTVTDGEVGSDWTAGGSSATDQ